MTLMMLINIRMAFHFLNSDMMRKIRTTMIRPKLENPGVIWFPQRKKHVLKLARIQRKATIYDNLRVTLEVREPPSVACNSIIQDIINVKHSPV